MNPTGIKNTFILLTSLLLAPLAAMHADDAPTAPSNDKEKQIEARRVEYLHWIVENFGKLESTMDMRDACALLPQTGCRRRAAASEAS